MVSLEVVTMDNLEFPIGLELCNNDRSHFEAAMDHQYAVQHCWMPDLMSDF